MMNDLGIRLQMFPDSMTVCRADQAMEYYRSLSILMDWELEIRMEGSLHY